MAPLFFFAVLLSAAGSAHASPSLWLAALLSIVAAGAWQRAGGETGVTAIALALAAYATWTMAHNFFGAVYTPAGSFHPLFAVAGFMLVRRAGEPERARLFSAFVLAAAGFAIWGLAQSLTGGGRAHALFETPNTLATLLNLALAPLLFRIAHGDATRRVLAVAVLICVGVAATLSRGGFLALAAGLALVLLLCPVRLRPAGVLRALEVVLLGAALGGSALLLAQWLSAQPLPAEAQVGGVASTLANSLGSRAELYRLALAAAGEHPWVGTGYLGFRSLLEAHRAEVASYATENITYFVHDDYLQTLVELGVPGLLALLALILVPFWRVSRENRADLVSRYAPLAGIATMAVHAFGDFPFYVPVCLLGFGMLAGQVDAATASEPENAGRVAAPRRAALFVSALALAIVLLPPPLAEAAAVYGNRSWQHADAASAAYGFELARRLEPRDWRYHWYAGQFWYAQAQAGNAAAAPLADQAFAAAIAANAQEPRPLLSRIATQIRFAAWLEHPQAAATLRDWADRALALAPLNPAVRRDHAAALERLSRTP